MKKVFLTLAVALGMIASANAQLVVGGGINFGVNTNNGTTKQGDLGITNKDDVDFSFGFAPKVGYIINEKWEVGGKLYLGYDQTMQYAILKDAEGLHGKAFKDTKTYDFRWAIQPYARFRCFEIKGFGLWIEGLASIGTSINRDTKVYAYKYNDDIVGRTEDQAKATNDNRTKATAFQGSLSFQPVLTYAINEHWILETSLNFLGFNLGGEVFTTKTKAPSAADPTVIETIKETRNTFDFDLNVNSNNIATLGFLQIGASYKF